MSRGLCVLALLWVLVPTAQAALPPLGVQDDSLLVQHWTKTLIDPWEYPRSLGAEVVRINVMPNSLDNAVLAAQVATAQGMKVYATITGQPGSKPDFMWAAYATERMAPYLSYVSAWNEPDLPVWWPRWRPMRQYVRYYLTVYWTARHYAPHAKVLLGETSPWAGHTRWLGRLPRLPGDGFAHHPYQFNSAPTTPMNRLRGREKKLYGIGRLSLLKHAIYKKQGRHLPLYLSEFGYSKKRPARWMCDAWRVSAKQGARLFLAYQLLPAPTTPDWNTALFANKNAPDALRRCSGVAPVQ